MTRDDLLYRPLRKRAQRGFRGYPVATLAFYGPDSSRASKVAVGLVLSENAEPSEMKRWHTPVGDIRRDPVVGDEVIAFIRHGGAATVIVSDGILGCPHEEGIDYPEGEPCPECPYWRDRDRFTDELIS
jgi:hypothetical protein